MKWHSLPGHDFEWCQKWCWVIILHLILQNGLHSWTGLVDSVTKESVWRGNCTLNYFTLCPWVVLWLVTIFVTVLVDKSKVSLDRWLLWQENRCPGMKQRLLPRTCEIYKGRTGWYRNLSHRDEQQQERTECEQSRVERSPDSWTEPFGRERSNQTHAKKTRKYTGNDNKSRRSLLGLSFPAVHVSLSL